MQVCSYGTLTNVYSTCVTKAFTHTQTNKNTNSHGVLKEGLLSLKTVYKMSETFFLKRFATKATTNNAMKAEKTPPFVNAHDNFFVLSA